MKAGTLRGVKIALGAVTLLLSTCVLSGCGEETETKEAPTLTVAGSVVVYGGSDTINSDGDSCENVASGYTDVNAGTQVVVKNSDGKQVGVDELIAGMKTDDSLGCDFGFRLDDVPEDATYTLTIADRPPYSFNADDADALTLTLGG